MDGIWKIGSDGLGGQRGRWAFEAAGIHGDHREIPDAGSKGAELIRGDGRVANQNTLVEVCAVMAVQDAVAGEIVERRTIHLRGRLLPLQRGDARARVLEYRDRERTSA